MLTPKNFNPIHLFYKNRYRLTVFFFFIFSIPLLAQEKHTISGAITDASSGEELIGASIWVPELGKSIIHLFPLR